MVYGFIPVMLAGSLLLSTVSASSAPGGSLRQIGVAKIDITPDYPVRLSGYAARKSESEGVAQRIWAKALAIGGDNDNPAILITVDNCGVPATLREELVRRLAAREHINGDRVTVCSTHTHSAPWLRGYLPNLVLGPVPEDQVERMERYTKELTDALEEVALQALKNRTPSRLSRGSGTASFAANRRTKGGPVDHDLPALFVTGPDGEFHAVFASYACHCTTLTGEFNQVCGDWAGYAQEFLERDYPGVIAMVAIGCGGDANPNPRPGFDMARNHGQEIAEGVKKAWTSALTPVEGPLDCRTKQIELPFDTLPTRDQWTEQAKDNGYVGQHARLNLARLNRGENLPRQLLYLVQTWALGDEFAMVFLPGEVVVDYSLRLKRESPPGHLWVHAYANGVPCYIPSERILREGGYEGGGAMVYYDLPTRFAPGIEDLIVNAVQELLPKPLRTLGSHAPSVLHKP